MADTRFRFLQQRTDGYVQQGEIQIADTAEIALRGLNPAGGTRWLVLNLDDETFGFLEARARNEIDIVSVGADRFAAVQPSIRPVA